MRSCYKTRMKFFADDDRLVEVQWYFTKPGAPALPFYNRFASGNWAANRIDWPGPGEVLGVARSWVDGATPATANATHICGTPEQFANGLTLADIGPPVLYDLWNIPTCCQEAGDVFGVAIDGSATVETEAGDLGDGGPSVDGAAAYYFTGAPIGNGGPSVDGAAIVATTTTTTGNGGPSVGGGAAMWWTNAATGNGGATLDGAATVALTPSYMTGYGGIESDGAADVSTGP